MGHNFKKAHEAFGIGHSLEEKEKPYDLHCPKLPQDGLNYWQDSCKERRTHIYIDKEVAYYCKDYPDCKKHKGSEGGRKVEEKEEPEITEDFIHAVCILYNTNMNTRDIGRHFELSEAFISKVKQIIIRNPDIYGTIPKRFMASRKSFLRGGSYR